jgi:DNA mismatch repair protein MutL
MGFRGEALASIAAVAQVELKTRRAIDELGVRVLIEASEVKIQEQDQCPQGTSIQVRNLFYNVPARRNFLKSNPIEMKHIIEDFQRIALANPDIHFSLHHNDAELFHLPAANLKQRILGIFGTGFSKNLVPVSEETDAVVFSGYVGKPEFAKKTRGEQLFFVNRRFIKSSYLQHAVMTAYEDLLPKDSFPLYVIFLEIDPSRIDVNVHPTKTEIKFDDERLIYNYLKVAVRHSLGQYSVTPTLDFEQEIGMLRGATGQVPSTTYVETIPSDFAKRESTPGTDSSVQFSRPDTLRSSNLRNWQKLFDGLENEDWSSGVANNAAALSPQQGSTTEAVQDAMLDDESNTFSKVHKEPYQIHGRYIVSQIKSGFVLIDQQSAHERVLYEKYIRLFDESGVSSQAELFPKTVTLAVGDAEILREILPEMNRMGFDIAEFGQSTFVIHGIPAEMKQGVSEQQIIENLIEQYKLNVNLSIDLKEKIARAMARNAAIKKGKVLDVMEMRSLIDQLFACAIPFLSPSGTKCFITYELEELEKLF